MCGQKLICERRRLYRAGIVISVLLDGIRDLRGIFMRIAYLCNANLNPLDIQHCCHMSNGKLVLVNLYSICIMRTTIFGEAVRKKVYLNDHLQLLFSSQFTTKIEKRKGNTDIQAKKCR